jgi:DtxR family Mn-dependent transcriptional regulator
MNLTVTEENYIKAIFHLQQAEGNVSTNQLAASLNTKPASVTDMLKKLTHKSLLNYEPYQGVRLSKDGKKQALIIVRKHRLWEYFLVDKLQFGWDEVHEVAEELEHVRSTKLVDKLDSFLGHPKFDPHGDPIPDSHGNMVTIRQFNLIDIKSGALVEVCSVGVQSAELLELLRHKNIGIGSVFQIVRKFDFDHSIEIHLKNNQSINISQQLAQALFVKLV